MMSIPVENCYNYNDNCFLSTKSKHYNDFYRIMWHWKIKFK